MPGLIADKPAEAMTSLRVQVLIICFPFLGPANPTATLPTSRRSSRDKTAHQRFPIASDQEDLVPRILRLATVGPVFDLWGKIGSRLMGEIFGHIDRFL